MHKYFWVGKCINTSLPISESKPSTHRGSVRRAEATFASAARLSEAYIRAQQKGKNRELDPLESWKHSLQLSWTNSTYQLTNGPTGEGAAKQTQMGNLHCGIVKNPMGCNDYLCQVALPAMKDRRLILAKTIELLGLTGGADNMMKVTCLANNPCKQRSHFQSCSRNMCLFPAAMVEHVFSYSYRHLSWCCSQNLTACNKAVTGSGSTFPTLINGSEITQPDVIGIKVYCTKSNRSSFCQSHTCYACLGLQNTILFVATCWLTIIVCRGFFNCPS